MPKDSGINISPAAEQKVRKALESYRLFHKLTDGMDDQGRRAILRRFYLCVLLRNGSKNKEVLTEERTGKDARTLENFSVRTLNYVADLYLFGKAVGLNREAHVALVALSSFMDSYQKRIKELPEEVTVHAEWRDEWLSATLYLLAQFTEARTGTKHYDILAQMLIDTAAALGIAKTYTGDFIRKRATRYGTAVSGLQAWWNTLHPPIDG